MACWHGLCDAPADFHLAHAALSSASTEARQTGRPPVTTRFVRSRGLCLAAGTAAALLALSACSSSDDSGSSDASASASGTPKVTGTIEVFAASSLQESFTTLGKEFESAYPGTKVEFNFAGSDTLAASITGGAPADVFAAASSKTMKAVTDADYGSGTPATFARNQLEIATLPGNPDHITSLKDLTKSGLKVALCAKTVPF